MGKSRSFLSIAAPSGTVFLSSFCVMVLELVAARLIARHLGSSLYTWTAVIGVVLAGITIGNYLGGRAADRFNPRKTLAVVFVLASAACVLTVVLNNLIGQWLWLWRFGWRVLVFSHVSVVFLIPSTLLGMISPVVAKTALEKGLPTGRTVGDIYAWGAAGSIAGTFATGYYLIPAMGTTAIVWTVAAILLVLAVLYWARLRLLHVWAVIFVTLMTVGLAPVGWAEGAGVALALREKRDPKIIYEDESPYCYIAVKRVSESPDRRAFMQDKLMHSDIVMDNVLDLKYSYERIHAAATHLLSQGRDRLSVLVIGGGGYVFPRYVEQLWPGSRIDVVEIDPGVTEAAIQAFGLKRDAPINTFTMDARAYVHQLLEQRRSGKPETLYDFIYEDALSDYSIPYQLTTKEFNDGIAQILTDRGVYMIELIDIYDSGLFIGAFVNTLEQTFPFVYVVAENGPRAGRNTFVILAGRQEISVERLRSQELTKNLDLWILSDSEIEALKTRARGLVLTDDHAPVENLLAPVALKDAADLLVGRYRVQAEELLAQGRWEQSISRYRDIIDVDPASSMEAHNKIGMILTERGRFSQALQAFESSVQYSRMAGLTESLSNIHYNMAVVSERAGNKDEALRYFREAIRGYREDLAGNPDSAKIAARLGNALAAVGDFGEATTYFQRAVNLNPYDTKNHSLLAQVLAVQNRFDEAAASLSKAIAFMSRIGNDEAAAQLQRYLQSIEAGRSATQQ
ncbi:MAG: fused MFS/spermidine synthase [Phycisphaerales bacterium]|nr:MAG: fused MFS/spermidine synthase [Phycisphaerales bacterium]